jgi:hypothetical protein
MNIFINGLLSLLNFFISFNELKLKINNIKIYFFFEVKFFDYIIGEK